MPKADQQLHHRRRDGEDERRGRRRRTLKLWARTAIVAMMWLGPSVLLAQPPAAQPAPVRDVDALAKETQNPVGNLTTVPFQFNFNTGGDLEDRTFFNLNFQPVIPFKVSSNVNVVARTIVPINSAPVGDGRSSGIGDIQQQIFFTPAKPGAMIWGVGYNVERPDGGPGQQLRFIVALLFPR